MNYLKQKLKERHMTQCELAKRLGINKSAVTHYIKGTVKLKNLSVDKIYVIANILDLDLKEFIEEIMK